MSTLDLDFRLHPKQLTVLQSPATEILFGGAAGPGKSHLLRVLSILWAWAFPGLQVYLFRRISDDLTRNHVEGPKGYRSLLAPWVNAGKAEIVEGEIRFPWGSKIFLCHCSEEKHRFKYQGAEMHVLLMDELTHFTEVIYRYLRSRVRMVNLPVPAAVRARFPRIVCASNPGNVGHQWVKRAFIDGAEPYAVRPMSDSEGGKLRQFIPARLDDNPSLLQDDPTYRATLRGLGSPALVKAMEDGDWNVIEGAFFDGWSTERHVIRPFQIPKHWTRFRSFDWGYAKPFSVGWWAIATDDTMHPDGELWIPRGAMVRYREWYGAKRDADGQTIPNVGLRLDAPAVARGIVERSASELEQGIAFAYSVADPACFAEDGGPSKAEQMANAGVMFKPGDNKRDPGWTQMRGRLAGDTDGRPMVYTFDTCADSIRTIPALQHDPHKPEDLDTEMEDHAADEWRYAHMSRPWASEAPKPKLDPLRTPTFDEINRIHDRQWQNSSQRI